MTIFKHIALNGQPLSMSSSFIQDILEGKNMEHFKDLAGKKGAIFSNMTLAQFMAEEEQHEVYDLTSDTHRSIRTYSSGEQKKALLTYLLNKKPEFLIVDNPFDALDAESVASIEERLIELSKQMPIIQVYKRKNDLLPFITHGLRIEADKIVYSDTIDAFLEKYHPQQEFVFEGSIPPPVEHYNEFDGNLVEFVNVNVNYHDRQILQNINWCIKPGEFWQLTGPNGSGKTTMLTMINGDNPKAFGQEIYIFGKRKGSGESVWDIKKRVGYFTPAMMDLFKHRHTAEQMVISGLVDSIGLYHKATEMQMHLAEQWLKLIGVYDKRHRPYIELSQVQQRMVLMARAIIKHPPLLILDEPSNGLDDYSAKLLSTLINKMAAESTTAVLYVSHRLEPDLQPQYIFKLIPTSRGSVGKVIQSKS